MLADLGWWFIGCFAVPLVVFLVICRVFPPRLHYYRFDRQQPLKVISIRLTPESRGLATGRQELER